MKKNNLKNIILVVIFVVLAPLILVGITSLSNSLGRKIKTTTSQTTEQQVAKVPEETKVTNDNLPKAKEEKSSNDKDSEQNQNNDNTNSSNNRNNANTATSKNPTVGQDYIVKSGDSLFSIASAAYGEANAQNGVNKIKEANNLENNNITAGQKIQIPKL